MALNLFHDFGITEKVGNILGIQNDPRTGKSQLLGPTIGSSYSGQITTPSSQLRTQQAQRSGAILGTTTGRAAAPTNQPQQVQQQQQAGQQGPGPNDVDAIYNPINDFLNQMAQEYESQRGPAEANINTSSQNALTDVANKEAEQIGTLNTQEGKINTNEQNALAQARQVFNELQQRNVALYGSGSSAGPAANELLGRSTSQQFGQIGNTALEGRDTIETERGKVKNFTAQKKVEIQQQKDKAIQDLQAEFRNGLLQINQMKAQNESAKAAARLDLLQRAQEQAFQIEQADKAYQRAIDQFEQEKSATLGQVSQYQSLQGVDTAASSQFQQILANPAYSTAQKYVQGLQLGLDPKLVGTAVGYAAKDKTDEQVF